MDTISSLSSGVTNVLKDVLGLTAIIVSYGWVYDHVALMEIESKWGVFVVAFIAIDFAVYWSNRLAHGINFFWKC